MSDSTVLREILHAIQDSKHVLYTARDRAAGAYEQNRIDATITQLSSAQMRIVTMLSEMNPPSHTSPPGVTVTTLQPPSVTGQRYDPEDSKLERIISVDWAKPGCDRTVAVQASLLPESKP